MLRAGELLKATGSTSTDRQAREVVSMFGKSREFQKPTGEWPAR